MSLFSEVLNAIKYEFLEIENELFNTKISIARFLA